MKIGDKVKFGNDANTYVIIGGDPYSFHLRCIDWYSLTRWVRRADVRKVSK